ncbi:hypothetical protein TWF730_007061 [Orbilia blumenaviensis]|uniref:F-box domain-containing protein n=1 Tax=Orbilia blumenaviensis TaxID=1796055 RepID=A0AAV9VG48_9PEZI
MLLQRLRCCLLSQQQFHRRQLQHLLQPPSSTLSRTMDITELSLSALSLTDTNPRAKNRTSPLLIPELLELILTALPPLQVLTTCRQVCALWRDIIDTSPVIKYTTWRAETIPGRKPLRITDRSYERNPLVKDILGAFWRRLNYFIIENDHKDSTTGLSETTSENNNNNNTPPKRKKKSRTPPQIDISSFISRYHKILNTLIFSNSPPLDLNIRLTIQKYASKHVIARSYRSVSTEIPVGWVQDLTILLDLMDEMLKLWNEGVYVPGRRNVVQAEIGGCVFLYSPWEEEGGKRGECEVLEKANFECGSPWGVDIALVGGVKRVVRE